jgi:hypothetical protein
MARPLILALAAVLALSACGNSRLNPFNWFKGRDREVPTVAAEAADVDADGRGLIAEVTRVVVEPMAGGAIVRATGLPPRQGYWDAELVPREIDENGVLVYDYRVFPPLEPTAVSTPQSREITAAAYLSDIRLQAVSEIVVQGQANARAVAR